SWPILRGACCRASWAESAANSVSVGRPERERRCMSERPVWPVIAVMAVLLAGLETAPCAAQADRAPSHARPSPSRAGASAMLTNPVDLFPASYFQAPTKPSPPASPGVRRTPGRVLLASSDSTMKTAAVPSAAQPQPNAAQGPGAPEMPSASALAPVEGEL